jgi:hypothetical protein
MVIKIPAFEMLEKVNRSTKSSFKPSFGCSAGSRPAHELAATVYPPLDLVALTQCTISGQGTARLLSTMRIVHHKYLNLK